MARTSKPTDETSTQAIRIAIDEVLDSGSIAVLVTVIQSEQLAVGAKFIIIDAGKWIGDFGDPALNRAVAAEAAEFLRTRAEAKTSSVSDFAAELTDLADSLLLFERVEKEPRLVVAGAGHVGASLARLASL